MRTSESPFKSYMSKRILSFANLICSSVSGPKAQKSVCVLLHSVIVKSYGTFFEKVLEKCEAFVQKSLSLKNISKGKFADTLLLFMC